MNKLKLHIELAQRGLDRSTSTAGIAMEKLDAVFSHPDLIDEKTRNFFRNELLKDISIIEQSLMKKRDLQASAEELIRRQQEKIEQFEKIIEKKSAELQTLREHNRRKSARQTVSCLVRFFI